MAKFIPYTFTKKDVIGNFINDKQYENWIAGKVRSKKIVKVAVPLHFGLHDNLTGEEFEFERKVISIPFKEIII